MSLILSCGEFEDWGSYLISLGSQRHVTKADLDLKSLDSQSRPQFPTTNTLLEYSIYLCVSLLGDSSLLVLIL